MVTGVPGGRARSVLAAGPAARFADVRWVASTGSTNADALALVRDGAPEGIVVVADHQTAGRGRRGRVWEAPPGAGLLASIVLRPPTAVVEACTMAVAVAAVEAVSAVAGFAPRLKWPNDLVWPGDGSAPDRKLAGILAEADWPGGGAPAVVVGIGLNVTWPSELPPDLAEIAVACNHLTGAEVDREDLLIALLERLASWYGPLVATGDTAPLRAAWRDRSATLGRQVRVDLGHEVVQGLADDVTAEGHLVVVTETGDRRTVTTGDVVHLWST
jgi:BirA family transcriptional regulator, biotin operon repressor / biotin---[acetyl-CoA-carboxylase] ligase